MTTNEILPYTWVVGQEALKTALELCYIEPRIGGVLITGERGTGKSTSVRSFWHMATKKLPVTLPINATEDRVIGGWKIETFVPGKQPEVQPGLLEQADGGMLYIDEVNLLDDHIVNILLDAASTGQLVIAREHQDKRRTVGFLLVGTMNPEEGLLRPQLLDRFGLLVRVVAERDPRARAQILERVLNMADSRAVAEARGDDRALRQELYRARQAVAEVAMSSEMKSKCIQLAMTFDVYGHRAELVMALAARAEAARCGAGEVTLAHIQKAAPLALPHRRKGALPGEYRWTDNDDDELARVLRQTY